MNKLDKWVLQYAQKTQEKILLRRNFLIDRNSKLEKMRNGDADTFAHIFPKTVSHEEIFGKT